MTQTRNRDRQSASGAHKAGWLVSLGLHGSLALGAMVLLQQMQLALPEKPFEWNVAMVTPVDSPSPQAAVNESPPSSTSPAHPPVPAQRPPTIVPAQPLPPPVVTASAPPIQAQITPPHVEPAPTPPTQTVISPKPEPTREPVHEEPRLQPPATAPSHAVAPLTAPAETPTPAPFSTATSAPEPAPIPPEPVRAQVAAPPQPIPTPNRTVDTAAATGQPASTASTEVAALTPPIQPGTAQSDDGWLSTLMGKWIADLEKHYPATLRLEGVQGKVVLVAMLHENGTLSEVRIAKSSGNALLDQAAVTDVEQGPPIKLSRPLGRSQRPIKFSISYDLKTAR